jgi:mitochondrial ATPase complex subunit ATP10
MFSSSRVVVGRVLCHGRWPKLVSTKKSNSLQSFISTGSWRQLQLLQSCSCRSFSSTKNAKQEEEEEHSEEYALRHYGIVLHPDSIVREILPGNFVWKQLSNGKTEKRATDAMYGYYWMIKDLKRSDGKPILSNEILIPEKRSKLFPCLTKLESVSGEEVELPSYFLRNRLKDAEAQCTLVAVSFRDFGYQQLPSWLDPFNTAMVGKGRVEVVRLNITEGWFSKYFLRGLIRNATKRNTPPEEHDSTLLYFGSSGLDDFRDALRMHNAMAGYVFLLDGLGRVRFAGSGAATEAELQRLVKFAKHLL